MPAPLEYDEAGETEAPVAAEVVALVVVAPVCCFCVLMAASRDSSSLFLRCSASSAAEGDCGTAPASPDFFAGVEGGVEGGSGDRSRTGDAKEEGEGDCDVKGAVFAIKRESPAPAGVEDDEEAEEF